MTIAIMNQYLIHFNTILNHLMEKESTKQLRKAVLLIMTFIGKTPNLSLEKMLRLMFQRTPLEIKVKLRKVAEAAKIITSSK